MRLIRDTSLLLTRSDNGAFQLGYGAFATEFEHAGVLLHYMGGMIPTRPHL